MQEGGGALFTHVQYSRLVIVSGPRDPPKLDLDLSGITDPQSPYNVLGDTNSSLAMGLADSYVHTLQGNASVTYVNEAEGFKDDPDMTAYLVDQAEDLYQYR